MIVGAHIKSTKGVINMSETSQRGINPELAETLKWAGAQSDEILACIDPETYHVAEKAMEAQEASENINATYERTANIGERIAELQAQKRSEGVL